MFARRPGLPIVALALIKFKFMLRQCVSAHTVTFRLTAHALSKIISQDVFSSSAELARLARCRNTSVSTYNYTGILIEMG